MMTVSRYIPFLPLALIALPAISQSERQLRPLHYENEYQPRGWFFAPGATWMWPSSSERQNTRISNAQEQGDTLYTGEFGASGRPGIYAEFGRHKFIRNYYVISHLDYGAHFKMLRGTEDFRGRVLSGTALTETENRGRFSESFAGLFFNVSNILQLSNTSWLHNTVGANAEYRVISRRSYEGLSTGMPHVFPDAFQGQLHYKIGFGWKADPGLYVLTSLETPILNVYPFYDGKSTLPYFSTRYRPLILSVRIMFLDRTRTRECENQPGQRSTDVDKEKPGKNASDNLFGPDVKYKGRKKR
jgi:hypothetical protein